MIANDARTMVYESIHANKLEIPKELENKINEEIISAAESMSFRARVELFPCNDDCAENIQYRNNIVAFYHSLGYNCYIHPNNGLFELVVEW